MAHVPQTKPETLQADIAAAAAYLRGAEGGQVRALFSVGFCFGGALSYLQAASGLGYTGVIGFYGWPLGLRRWPDRPRPIDEVARYTCPVLSLFGGADEGIPQSAVDEFDAACRQAGVKHESTVYAGAPHSFFDRKYTEFAEASADAWRRRCRRSCVNRPGGPQPTMTRHGDHRALQAVLTRPASGGSGTPPAPARLGALRHRDFRLFWSGQLVSLIGTWMQSVGQAWLVLELTDSAFQLGLVTALQFAPILVLSPVGGAMSDRFPKRRIILATQSTMMVQAFVLAILVGSGHVRYWHVAVLAAIYGVGRAIDIPARQAFITDLVGKPDLPNAVALNSVVFNGARIVGPAVAGLLIARFGVSVAFLLNGLSFVAVLAALVAIRTAGYPDPGGRLGIRAGLAGAVAYAAGTPPVVFTLGLLLTVSVLVLNFNVVVPLVAREVLNQGARGFGILMSALGVGAVIAGIGLTLLRQGRPPLWFLAAAGGDPQPWHRRPRPGWPLRGNRPLAGVSRLLADPLLNRVQHHPAARHPRCPARTGDGPLRAGVRRDDPLRVAPDRHHRRAPWCPCGLRSRWSLRPGRRARSRAHLSPHGARVGARGRLVGGILFESSGL